MSAGGRQRLRLLCRGVVQGVGFRPAVHRHARALALGGFVRNDADGVVIEIEGDAPAVREFVDALPRALPPLARIHALASEVVVPLGEREFVVQASVAGVRRQALVPPDAALCRDCRAEMEDARDRRHRYPFTTCTNCGPRFTLALALPYDRERTTMACFPLCEQCRREYTDPADRRFHAEPVCCPSCGPRLWLQERSGRLLGEGPAALEAARQALAHGAIVAVKGLGGFQLACRADDEAVVKRLRERKRRPSKPLAVMVADAAAARRLVRLGPGDEAALTSPQAPVVLAPRRPTAAVTPAVAPGLDDLGVMVTTTPLHVELFRSPAYDALVMTSGNATDEPICRGNREALSRLGGIADLFLLHDRDVIRRVDDSVVRSDGAAPALVRRARGFVLAPLPLPVATPKPVLALGPYLQTTACLASGGDAFCSQHVGDLEGEPARAFLAEVVDEIEEFLATRGEVIVVDAHPDYPSTWLGERLARERDAEPLRVQHHLAHAAATLAEHGRFPAPGEHAFAVLFDGTGWGMDGTAWGGEWLRLDGALRWRRLAHLQPLPLVGGETAVREPWRVLAAALVAARAGELLPRLPLAALLPRERLTTVTELSAHDGFALATGAGRIFEAAGALAGLVAVNGYEGEAAARFEALAARAPAVAAWNDVQLEDAPLLPSAALLAAAARRIVAGEDRAAVAAGFHATFARLAVELTQRVIGTAGAVVALGGGCLVNRILRRALADGLRGAGYDVLLPARVPPGDGGLSYGQAVLGAVAAARDCAPRWEGDA
jgi:hydrogenase maturation protein HypF